VNGKGEEESEWREQESECHLPEHSKEELAAMQAGRAPRDLQRLVHGRHCSSISNFQFYLKNVTEPKSLSVHIS
jgi:hypothetical protein